MKSPLAAGIADGLLVDGLDGAAAGAGEVPFSEDGRPSVAVPPWAPLALLGALLSPEEPVPVPPPLVPAGPLELEPAPLPLPEPEPVPAWAKAIAGATAITAIKSMLRIIPFFM